MNQVLWEWGNMDGMWCPFRGILPEYERFRTGECNISDEAPYENDRFWGFVYAR